MTIVFANNAVSKLHSALTPSQNTVYVQPGTGELFPSPTGGQFFKLTIEDRRTMQIEIMHCIGRYGDVLTVERSQEDMVAQNFMVGATVSNRVTRDTFSALLAEVPGPNPLYLGMFSDPPTTDNDGNPLQPGMIYFDSDDNRVYFWTGASWVDPMEGGPPPVSQAGVFLLQDVAPGFDGVTTDFDLRYIDYTASVQTPDTTIAETFLVWLDGVAQTAGQDYTVPVVGTIHFTEAPEVDVLFHGVWIGILAGEQGVPGIPGPIGPAGGSADVSDTPPTPAVEGDLWWNSANGQLYVYYDDGSSAQWVAASTQGGGEGGGSGGGATAAVNFVIDGGGSPVTTGIKGDLEIPFNCTIDAATLLADQVGSIVVDIWSDAYGNFPPTVADTITASAKPTISAATKSQDTTLTGWIKTITAGQILRFNVNSAATITRVTLSLKVTRT